MSIFWELMKIISVNITKILLELFFYFFIDPSLNLRTPTIINDVEPDGKVCMDKQTHGDAV